MKPLAHVMAVLSGALPQLVALPSLAFAPAIAMPPEHLQQAWMAGVNSDVFAGDLKDEANAASRLRAQILLDRARFSPGEIDGRYGSNTERAIAAFQRSRQLPDTGAMDETTWAALNDAAAPALVQYTLTPQDVAGPFQAIPDDMMDKAKLPQMAFATVMEALGERFHASPELIEALNPGVDPTRAGTVLWVPNVASTPPAKAARVVVDRSDSSVLLQDAQGRTYARYPASTGSEHDPLPIGQWQIKGVARNPDFKYNPKLFWDAERGHTRTTIAAGPNNPVGVVWVDLTKDHYGIHGTPEPSKVGKTESHGCIRLTNWNAMAVADAVAPGVPALLQE